MAQPDSHGTPPPATLVREKAADGWQYAGTENLTIANSQIDRRSFDVPLQTEVSLRHKYGGPDKELQFVLVSSDVVFPTDDLAHLDSQAENMLCYVFSRVKK